MACPASRGFLIPIFSPTEIVTPMESPVTIMVAVCSSILPVATPDTSSVLPNCPTTNRSTPP